jgi:hypothetical protein
MNFLGRKELFTSFSSLTESKPGSGLFVKITKQTFFPLPNENSL